MAKKPAITAKTAATPLLATKVASEEEVGIGAEELNSESEELGVVPVIDVPLLEALAVVAEEPEVKVVVDAEDDAPMPMVGFWLTRVGKEWVVVAEVVGVVAPTGEEIIRSGALKTFVKKNSYRIMKIVQTMQLANRKHS